MAYYPDMIRFREIQTTYLSIVYYSNSGDEEEVQKKSVHYCYYSNYCKQLKQ